MTDLAKTQPIPFEALATLLIECVQPDTLRSGELPELPIDVTWEDIEDGKATEE